MKVVLLLIATALVATRGNAEYNEEADDGKVYVVRASSNEGKSADESMDNPMGFLLPPAFSFTPYAKLVLTHNFNSVLHLFARLPEML